MHTLDPDKHQIPRITAAIVTMNRSATAITCLEHLAAQTRRPNRILVINNASTDDTKERLEAFQSTHDDLTIATVNLEENVGNAGGMEIAFESEFKMDTDAVWILDDDSWPAPDALEQLLKADTPEQSLRSCHVVDLDSNKLSWPLQIRKKGRWHLIENEDQLPQQAVVRIRRSWLGALVTRSIYDMVGNVNGQLFIRGEDEDYPRRIENEGIAIFMVMDSILHHPAVEKLYKICIFGHEVILEHGLSGDKLYYRLRNSWWSTKRDRGFLSMLAISLLHGALLLKNQRPLRAWAPIWWEALLDAHESRLGKRKPNFLTRI